MDTLKRMIMKGADIETQGVREPKLDAETVAALFPDGVVHSGLMRIQHRIPAIEMAARMNLSEDEISTMSFGLEASPKAMRRSFAERADLPQPTEEAGPDTLDI